MIQISMKLRHKIPLSAIYRPRGQRTSRRTQVKRQSYRYWECLYVCLEAYGTSLGSNSSKAGSVVVSYVSSPMATWMCLVTLLSVHLATNHAAVKAVVMDNLNRQRANIVLSNLFDGKGVLTPEAVSFHERIFEWDGILRWRGSTPFAKAKIGISLQELLTVIAPAHSMTGAIRDSKSIFQTLIKIHQNEDFLLWYCNLQKTAYIVLKKGAVTKTHLKAWAIGLCVAHKLTDIDATSAGPDKVLQVITRSLSEVSDQWDDCIKRLTTVGWDTDIACLETSSGRRVCLPIENTEAMAEKHDRAAS